MYSDNPSEAVVKAGRYTACQVVGVVIRGSVYTLLYTTNLTNKTSILVFIFMTFYSIYLLKNDYYRYVRGQAFRVRLKRDFYLKYVTRSLLFEFKVENFQPKFFLVIKI